MFDLSESGKPYGIRHSNLPQNINSSPYKSDLSGPADRSFNIDIDNQPFLHIEFRLRNGNFYTEFFNAETKQPLFCKMGYSFFCKDPEDKKHNIIKEMHEIETTLDSLKKMGVKLRDLLDIDILPHVYPFHSEKVELYKSILPLQIKEFFIKNPKEIDRLIAKIIVKGVDVTAAFYIRGDETKPYYEEKLFVLEDHQTDIPIC